MKTSILFASAVLVLVALSSSFATETRVNCIGTVPQALEDDINILNYPSEITEYLNTAIIKIGQVTGNPKNDMMEGSKWTFSGASTGIILGDAKGSAGVGIFFGMGLRDSLLVDSTFNPEKAMRDEPFFGGTANRLDIFAGKEFGSALSIGLRGYHGYTSILVSDFDTRSPGYHERLKQEEHVSLSGFDFGVSWEPTSLLEFDIAGGYEAISKEMKLGQFTANYGFPTLFVDTTWVSAEETSPSGGGPGYRFSGRFRFSLIENTDFYGFLEWADRELSSETDQLNISVQHTFSPDTSVVEETETSRFKRARSYERVFTGTGMNLRLDDDALLILGAGLDWLHLVDDQYFIHPQYGDQFEERYDLDSDHGIILFGGVEIPLFKFLTLRTGLQKRFYTIWNTETSEYVYSEDDGSLAEWNRDTTEERMHPLDLTFGTGINLDKLSLDVVFNHRFFYTYGMASFSGDTPVLEISAKYRF